jgi:hypothetical protein
MGVGREPKRRGRFLCATTIMVGLALAATACSSPSTGRSVASLPGAQSHTANSSSTAHGDQSLVDFARCMRAHGVPMSDPFHRPGHSGLSIDVPPQDAATRPAYAACNHYIASLVEAKQAHGAAMTAAHIQELTHYAQCMRSHDIDMLDPGSQGQLNLGNVPGITSDFGRYSPQFRAADVSCRHLLPAGVSDDGTGP